MRGLRHADTALPLERHTAAEPAYPTVPQVLIDRAEPSFPCSQYLVLVALSLHDTTRASPECKRCFTSTDLVSWVVNGRQHRGFDI